MTEGGRGVTHGLQDYLAGQLGELLTGALVG